VLNNCGIHEEMETKMTPLELQRGRLQWR